MNSSTATNASVSRLSSQASGYLEAALAKRKVAANPIDVISSHLGLATTSK